MNSTTNCQATTAHSLDHIVIAAKTLKQGIDYVADHLGMEPQPGGQHTRIGTHNALLSLGADCYLEVIAIDPELPTPNRPRWFGLDQIDIQSQLEHSPRLLHWVVRTSNIKHTQNIAPQLFGPIQSMTRNQLEWLITIPTDGSLPSGGVIPSLIQWLTDPPPSTLLPDRNLRLSGLELGTATPDLTNSILEQLQLTAAITVRHARTTSLKATVTTPNGTRIIE